MPNGSPITDQIIEASIQWAERMMQRIDSRTQVVDKASEFYFCSNRRGELVNLIRRVATSKPNIR